MSQIADMGQERRLPNQPETVHVTADPAWRFIGAVGRYLRFRKLLRIPASQAHRDHLVSWLVRRSKIHVGPTAEK